MATVFFVLLAAVIALYVVLDGFDLGAGALHFALGRSADERERITRAIGPVWSGNEVWVIAAGGILFLAFPKVYSGALSGLYFGLVIVLWLLIGRGLALELRHHVDHPLWHQACDAVFCIASAALAFVLGVALGNVVRGVPIGSDGFFQLTLFHILNWYAILVGLLALLVICGQGASFLALRADGSLGDRASEWARRLLPLEAFAIVAMVGPTYAVRHHMLTVFGHHPWALIFPLAGAAALGVAIVSQWRGLRARAFTANSIAVAALFGTMAAGVYPWLLPAHQGRAFGLSVSNAAAGHHALVIAIVWLPIGLLLAVGYFVFIYRLLFRSPRA
jgi:cytochrome bd ubiquinol oxidase subunit II